jgi:hypothetical protein
MTMMMAAGGRINSFIFSFLFDFSLGHHFSFPFCKGTQLVAFACLGAVKRTIKWLCAFGP